MCAVSYLSSQNLHDWKDEDGEEGIWWVSIADTSKVMLIANHCHKKKEDSTKLYRLLENGWARHG